MTEFPARGVILGPHIRNHSYAHCCARTAATGMAPRGGIRPSGSNRPTRRTAKMPSGAHFPLPRQSNDPKTARRDADRVARLREVLCRLRPRPVTIRRTTFETEVYD